MSHVSLIPAMRHISHFTDYNTRWVIYLWLSLSHVNRPRKLNAVLCCNERSIHYHMAYSLPSSCEGLPLPQMVPAGTFGGIPIPTTTPTGFFGEILISLDIKPVPAEFRFEELEGFFSQDQIAVLKDHFKSRNLVVIPKPNYCSCEHFKLGTGCGYKGQEESICLNCAQKCPRCKEPVALLYDENLPAAKSCYNCGS